ncbi:MAG: hypothetical protein P4L50_28615 [Anaerolineaceae bacterium]|nr:hypothetical protein [Anaerolineaceae bacterium]
MTDFHHNIFYYYRGPDQSNPEKKDQQLENNTTKALANTLRYCSPIVAQLFLARLGITTKDKVEVELQKSNIGTEKIRSASQRLLLGLVDKGEKNEISIRARLAGPQPPTGDSCPDAWLYGEDFVVLIESKVGTSSLLPDQMCLHYQKLKRNAINQPVFQVHTWAEIHKFFVGLLPELNDKNDKFLVEQFSQYLEYKNMSEFSGFEEGMFEFFVQDQKDPDTKQWIRHTMDLFGKKLLDDDSQGLRALNKSFYTMHHVGNFGSQDNNFWVAFGREKFRDFAHQTISLHAYGLDIYANIELISVVDKLRKKLRIEEQKFRKIISEIPEPFSVRIEERKNKNVQKYDYYPIATLEAGVYKLPNSGPYGLKDPDSNRFFYLEELLKEIEYPYLTVRKQIDRKQVLDLSSKGNADILINKVLAIMRDFQPLVEFIND